MALTDNKVKNAKPKEKSYKLGDSGGLYIQINKNGSKYWRYKYRLGGTEKLLALGVYPEVTLKAAREKHQQARLQVAEDINPSEMKKVEKLTRAHASDGSFERIAMEWFAQKAPHWSASHSKRVKANLEKDLIPHIGKRQPNDISAPELLAVLRKVEARGAIETAHRVKQVAGQVFSYAIVTARAERNPATDLTGALQMPKKTHLAAITDPKLVGSLLNALDGYEGTTTVRHALQLAPLVFTRPGELRHAEWKEIDFEKGLWEIPAEKMKLKQPHIVPLSRQAQAILQEQYKLTGQYQYVFPSPRSPRRPMSDNAVLSAFRRMGIDKNEMSGHGFRAMARTILDEVLEYRIEWIEQQLAHAVRDANGRAYNRTKHLPQRIEMMQRWADYLSDLKQQA